MKIRRFLLYVPALCMSAALVWLAVFNESVTSSLPLSRTNQVAVNREEKHRSGCGKLRTDCLDRVTARTTPWRNNFNEGLRWQKTHPLHPVVSFFDRWEPWVQCLQEERIGVKHGDGGKWFCGDLTPSTPTRSSTADAARTNNTGTNTGTNTALTHEEGAGEKSDCLVYSIGSNNEWEFERSVLELWPHCEVHTFDHTGTGGVTQAELGQEAFDKQMPELHANMPKGVHFHPVGVGPDINPALASFTSLEASDPELPARAQTSVSDLMRILGHTGRTLSILKMDIEGWEHSTLPPMLELCRKGRDSQGRSTVPSLHISQLLIEMHAFSNSKRLHPDYVTELEQSMTQMFTAIAACDLVLFHKERNHWGCKGASCGEYSFASEQWIKDTDFAVTCQPWLNHLGCPMV